VAGAFLAIAIGMCALPTGLRADPLTLRYSGTLDLTTFGGTPSVFAGSVTWDPDVWWDPNAPPECLADFCLNGTPGAVSGTFAIDSVDYSDRIAPFSRFLVFGWGGLALDLYFTPPIDLDGGPALDVEFLTWLMHADPLDYSIFVDDELPQDLSFLSRVKPSYLEVAGGGVGVAPDTFKVVPEPASTSLLFIGLLAAGARRRRGSHESPRPWASSRHRATLTEP
jgi:hypothetical protein